MEEEEAVAPEATDQESNVSPEEQAQYDLFMEKAGELIYGEGEVLPDILTALAPAGEEATVDKSSGEPVGNPAVLALANTTVQIVQKIDDAARQAGDPVSDDVLYHGAVEVLEMLVEIAETAKLHDYSEEEMQGALYQAIDLYRPIAQETGRTSEETLKGQFAEVADADAAGQLGDLLPGLGNATLGEPPVQAE